MLPSDWRNGVGCERVKARLKVTVVRVHLH